MAEQGSFQAVDKGAGEMFGYSLDVDDIQVVVGAMHSSGRCRTTWDFESGDLIGWTKTGSAFDMQPTFGDNSRYRNVYGGFGDKLSHGNFQSADIKGRYYIGTYEQRPGNGRNDYKNPHPSYSAGTIGGDNLEGTLTSDPFVILGDEVKFRIGGGCNHLTVYVELLVDGVPSMRETGSCRERMEDKTFAVSLFKCV